MVRSCAENSLPRLESAVRLISASLVVVLGLGDRPDRLPVLQHALLRTWELWRRSGGQGPERSLPPAMPNCPWSDTVATDAGISWPSAVGARRSVLIWT